jgi:hypothetical protein
VIAYNPTNNTWEAKPSLSEPRVTLRAAELFSVVHGVGGRNGSNVVAIAEAYKP